MKDKTNKERADAMEELRAALAELGSDEGLARFTEGHGLQSRLFAFSWRSDGLGIEYRLPYARVLSDAEDLDLDAARIGAAIRLAILLLAAANGGTLLHDGEAAISVEADGSGARYSIVDSDGEELDSGEDWEPLVVRLDAALPDDAGDVRIIWP